MTKSESDFHTPLSHGVYITGLGVVQPGQTVQAKAADVQGAVDGGLLAAGSAPQLAEPIPEDPAPAVIETDTGVPPDFEQQPTNNEKEADDAA